MSEDDVVHLVECSATSHEVAGLLSEVSCLYAHDVSTDESSVFSVEDELAETVRFAKGESLTVGTEE